MSEIKLNTELGLTEDGYFDTDLEEMEKGVRAAQGFAGDGKFVRQKDHMKEFGKTYYLKILPPAQATLLFLKQSKTLPFMTIPHGWFTHPTKLVDDGNGGKKNHRVFHISPSALGEPETIKSYLTEQIRDKDGYKGAPEEEVHELVQIFRSLYTNKNPKYKHLGGPAKDKWPDLMVEIEKNYPGHSAEAYKEMAQRIRYIYKIYQNKYFLCFVFVEEELNEEGESVPLTNESQIFDFEGSVKNAIWHKTKGLLAKSKLITSAKEGERKGIPFMAHKRYFAPTNLPTHDIILETFENRQFVGDSDRKGYVDFNAYFRKQPSKLQDGDSYYAEGNRHDLLAEARKGVRDEQFIKDMFATHFGFMKPEEFDKLYPDSPMPNNQDTTSSVKEKAEQIAANAKAKNEETTAAGEETEEAAINWDEVQTWVKSAQSLSDMSVPPPPELLEKIKEETGLDWEKGMTVESMQQSLEGEEGSEAETAKEEPAKEESKKKTTTQTRKSRKKADV